MVGQLDLILTGAVGSLLLFCLYQNEGKRILIKIDLHLVEI